MKKLDKFSSKKLSKEAISKLEGGVKIKCIENGWWCALRGKKRKLVCYIFCNWEGCC